MESVDDAASDGIPWIRLQPARITYVKFGTLAEKRLDAWQHWAALTLSSLAIMVVAAHFVVCFRGIYSKGAAAGSGDLIALQQQLNSVHHTARTYGLPIDEGHPLHSLIASDKGPSSPTKGSPLRGFGNKRGLNGGRDSGPRQQLQFDRFVVRGANPSSFSADGGHHPGLHSGFASKPLSAGASSRVGPPRGYHIVNKWGRGGRHNPGWIGGYYRPSYAMKDMFDLASGDDDDDNGEERGTAAGEVYYGLDGRARVVQYPQTLMVPEDDETPEEFAARQKSRRAYEHSSGAGGSALSRR
ncbi:hypothetical protein Pmar_PMAR005418 [Perkinsus marinus ATCC 50983]|uniref:Uncharacterized protein n=1 Tax=Perkinsus marinus (strain ATCC 50983 / TXsc) TaxID=423536 RepID=C5KBE8_PERM5|nr:hypothetical protein Pmar_PMAR005418 [Perkinsus marinus ATCC 50983]EER18474.1 hypothetical protein Pmar_PMAR005418 [Perkinsus marinus ATCC 50983]|eukprot:XP_002786678.1 hypothetical protein Pmar_PMAR005418 [Perkinsus marinus ATCC 50983]